MISDRAIGFAGLVLSTAFFLYYIAWIGVMPHVDRSHFTQDFFPPCEYGLFLASLVMVTGIGLSITLASFHVILKSGYHSPPKAHTPIR
ncbi:unnamed protein product [Phytomonas sp. Hart1]|nr:unnamed protein product [Phytomonas sp. Hart1]|eukprot:CCW67775.1 unnamed protein product [Phytomonas sp. isolate Hart1]